MTPWWAVLAIAAGGLVLVAVNWPGSVDGSAVIAWKDVNTAWRAHRSWYDAYIIGSALVLVGAAGAWRWTLALGAALGGAVFLAVIALVYLIGGLTYQGTSRWVATFVIAAAVAVVGWVGWRPAVSPRRAIPALGATLVGVGVVLTAIAIGITYNGVSFLGISNGAGLLVPLALIALAWPTLVMGEGAASRSLFAAAGLACAFLAAIDSIPLEIEGLTTAFTIGLIGYGTYTLGVLVAALRRPERNLQRVM